jgi:hypothetical protein
VKAIAVDDRWPVETGQLVVEVDLCSDTADGGCDLRDGDERAHIDDLGLRKGRADRDEEALAARDVVVDGGEVEAIGPGLERDDADRPPGQPAPSPLEPPPPRRREPPLRR